MIIGNIYDSIQIRILSENPKFKAAFDAIKTQIFENNTNDKVFYTDDSFGFMNSLNTKPFSGRYEAHKKYLDLFYCVEGVEEVIVTSSTSGKIVEPYSEEKDIYFLEKTQDIKITLHEGDYIILFPEDAHAPAIGDGSHLKKLVLKIKI